MGLDHFKDISLTLKINWSNKSNYQKSCYLEKEFILQNEINECSRLYGHKD